MINCHLKKGLHKITPIEREDLGKVWGKITVWLSLDLHCPDNPMITLKSPSRQLAYFPHEYTHMAIDPRRYKTKLLSGCYELVNRTQ